MPTRMQHASSQSCSWQTSTGYTEGRRGVTEASERRDDPRRPADTLGAEARAHLYEQLFDAAPLAFAIYEGSDPGLPTDFRLLAANAAARELRAELGADEALPTDTAERLAGSLRRGEPQQWTIRASHPSDGRDRAFTARCFPLDGLRVGLVVVDSTDRHEMERELARHVRDLERSNRELDEFAYVASHDLKSPLRDIDTLASFIAQDAGSVLPEGSRRHLQLLADRIQRMERLLADLLAYSRAGRMGGTTDPVDVRAAAEAAIAVVRPAHGFTVTARGHARLAIASAAIEQILRNLIDNAVKHHDGDAGCVTVLIDEGPSEVTVAVADDGPGIPPEYHERVFRMFQTLRPRDEKEGSGMGLAIVKRLVETTGGRVAVESGEGRGTTIRIVWPRHLEVSAP